MLTTLIVLSCLTVVLTNVPKFNELHWREFKDYPCLLRLAGLLLTTASALGILYATASRCHDFYELYVAGFFAGHAFSAMWARQKLQCEGPAA